MRAHYARARRRSSEGLLIPATHWRTHLLRARTEQARRGDPYQHTVFGEHALLELFGGRVLAAPTVVGGKQRHRLWQSGDRHVALDVHPWPWPLLVEQAEHGSRVAAQVVGLGILGSGCRQDIA